MSIQNAYNQWSGIYDTNNNPTRDLDAQIIRDVLGDLKFNSILELGFGTGKNTPFLAQIGKDVHALDFSEGMIQKAREKVKAENVRFEMADITKRWPCKDMLYDLITCNLVLEHIEDLSHIFSETARVLQSNGKFFINELHPFKQYQGTKARYERDHTIIEVDTFIHHISDFTNAATMQGLVLIKFNEYWHTEDEGKPPRLVSFLFGKP